MTATQENECRRLPGLFRLWDLQFVLSGDGDWRIEYAELTGDGTPLFSVYQRVTMGSGVLQ